MKRNARLYMNMPPALYLVVLHEVGNIPTATVGAERRVPEHTEGGDALRFSSPLTPPMGFAAHISWYCVICVNHARLLQCRQLSVSVA